MTDEAAVETIPFDQFAGVDIRVGAIVAAEAFPEARKPAFKLTIDFGETIGRKRSSAQITARYGPSDSSGGRSWPWCWLSPNGQCRSATGFIRSVAPNFSAPAPCRGTAAPKQRCLSAY